MSIIHVYEDCRKCPFRTLSEHSNWCDVHDKLISKRGVLPIPLDSCPHSEVFQKNMRTKLD